MANASNVNTLNSSTLDEDASYLDQYYFDIEEEPSMEEQEDVNLYDLYDNRTPYLSLKTPSGAKAEESQLEVPLDQQELFTKLWNVMKSSSSVQGDTFSTATGSRDSTGILNSKSGGDAHSTITFKAQGKSGKN